MALARCKHHVPDGRTVTYVKGVPAAGKGLVCGLADCDQDALVWLDAAELKRYQSGTTIFSAPTAAAKFRVEPSN